VELHPLAEAALAVLLGAGAALAVLWFYAAYGAWMDDAFESGRWVWFGLLLVFSFPAGLIAWLVVRAAVSRPHGRGAAKI
jgi:hypothetical protein